MPTGNPSGYDGATKSESGFSPAPSVGTAKAPEPKATKTPSTPGGAGGNGMNRLHPKGK